MGWWSPAGIRCPGLRDPLRRGRESRCSVAGSSLTKITDITQFLFDAFSMVWSCLASWPRTRPNVVPSLAKIRRCRLSPALAMGSKSLPSSSPRRPTTLKDGSFSPGCGPEKMGLAWAFLNSAGSLISIAEFP